MKKTCLSILMGFAISALSCSLEGVSNSPTPINHSSAAPAKGDAHALREEKYELLNRDEIDNTNTLAIPFDDSEIEDEEEINRDEKKEVFNLPHSR